MIPLLPEILLICLVIFLYNVFVFAKDDFMLLRKNVSLEQLFNTTFIGFIVSLFFARVGHIFIHPSKDYFNPLVFLVFPYFPGLSLATGILGTAFYLWFSLRKKKLPLGRIFDIFVLSFLLAMSVGLLMGLITIWVTTKKLYMLSLIAVVIYCLLAYFFVWFFGRSRIKDGGIGMLGLSFVGIIQDVLSAFSRGQKEIFHIGAEDIFMAVVWIVFLILFIRQEYTKTHIKKK